MPTTTTTGTQPCGKIPWSEQRERKLKTKISVGFYGCVILAIIVLVGLVLWNLWVIFPAIVALFACVHKTLLWNADKREMNKNRPFHGSAGLTNWKWHEPEENVFICGCGQKHSFETGESQATNINGDILRGVKSIVCECGKGHKKPVDLIP